MNKTGRQYEAVKFTYGETDIREMGQQLAREQQNAYTLEDRKKEVATEFKAQIDAAYGRVRDITTKLNNGYEMREVEVLVLYDTPKSGMKRVIRVDTNEELRDEAMSLAEMQSGFGFDGHLDASD